MGSREFDGLLKEFGISNRSASIEASPDRSSPLFADALFRLLGAEAIDSLDASNYEGATLIHDLNSPLPEHWPHQFDAVCEFGSLEHVFHFPNAIQTCLRMVKKGGHFLWVTPANNYFGHGFYQFSPELVHRILNPENGFLVEEMIAVEYGPLRQWYSVEDPASIGDRIRLVNQFPVLLMTRARKIEDAEMFSSPPQQSDYSASWELHEDAAQSPQKPGRLRQAKDLLIENCPRFARMIQSLQGSGLNKIHSFRNDKAFSKLDKKR